MEIFHTFPRRRGAGVHEPGGVLHVPRDRQGFGRFDARDRYGAFYFSLLAVSAVAEQIQAFRGRELTDAALRRADGSRLALARLELADGTRLVDLDDPTQLLSRAMRPSHVATSDRTRTRRIGERLFDEGSDGFLWWSALEASWPNGVVYAERALDRCRPTGDPEVLTLDHPTVVEAAAALGIGIAGGTDATVGR
ncbi:MAG: RES family NAD+ phosphorylase [Chloroflexota bacterium]|nr:RES family NAD+ phosphorylase [Chloroflexota bacterium]